MPHWPPEITASSPNHTVDHRWEAFNSARHSRHYVPVSTSYKEQDQARICSASNTHTVITLCPAAQCCHHQGCHNAQP
jgi:hypothetical protein